MSNTNQTLAEKKCYACENDSTPLNQDGVRIYRQQLKTSWQILDNKKIQQIFQFKDFKAALHFVNQVAKIAEKEGHHPDISIYYNKVEIILWTHSIDGLSENDFIIAAKIENLNLPR